MIESETQWIIGFVTGMATMVFIIVFLKFAKKITSSNTKGEA